MASNSLLRNDNIIVSQKRWVFFLLNCKIIVIEKMLMLEKSFAELKAQHLCLLPELFVSTVSIPGNWCDKKYAVKGQAFA